jgi:hypothetical protein
MVFYHNSPRSQKTAEWMDDEVQTIADFVNKLGLGDGQTEEFVVRPLQSELLDRYGAELGPRLFRDFVLIFDGAKAIKGRHHAVAARPASLSPP